MVLRPQINVNIQSNLSLIEPQGPGTIAVIGSAQWGPFDELKTITSLNEAIEYFKDDIDSTSKLTLIKGVDLMYRNGAGTVYALRVGDGTETTSSLSLTSGATSVITVYGKYKGRYGDNIRVTVIDNSGNKDVTVTDGVLTEKYTNSGNGYSSNIDIVSDINSSSLLVETTALTDLYFVDTLTETNLSGGIDGNNAITSSNITNAFNSYLLTEDFNILVVPGTTADSFHATMTAKMNDIETNEDKFAIFVSGINTDETIATATARTTTGKRFTLVAPSCIYTHRITGVQEYLDGSYLACAYAGVIASNFPQISPTHKTVNTEGIYVNTSTQKRYYNNGEQEQLLNAGIVPISKVGNSEACIRAVTRHPTKTEVWFEQNIVNIVDYIRGQVLTLLNPFIGKGNIARVRNIMAKNVDGLLEQTVLDEIINAYQQTIVSEGTSPDRVNVAITIKPVFAINFITINLTIDNVST